MEQMTCLSRSVYSHDLDDRYYFNKPSEKTGFHLAAQHGLQYLMTLLIGRRTLQGAHVESRDVRGRSPLCLAASKGHSDIVSLLLQVDSIDVDTISSGNTPLHFAIFGRHVSCVQTLLDNSNANPNIHNSNGLTPLHAAVRCSSDDIVRLLLRSGGLEGESQPHVGNVSLYDINTRAASTGVSTCVGVGISLEFLIFLLSLIAAQLSSRLSGRTFSKSLAKRNGAVIGRLPPANASEPDGITLQPSIRVHSTITRGLVPRIRRLLGWSRIDPNLTDPTGRTPLSYAAELGHARIVTLLLNCKSIEADKQDEGGKTSIWYAAYHRRQAVVRLLLESDKVSPDVRDKSGRTVLGWAAEWGLEDSVRMLLDTGKVNPDVSDKNGRRPLWLAAKGGYKGIVELLLATGKVDPEAMCEGSTPLWISAAMGHPEIITRLLATDNVNANFECMALTPLEKALTECNAGALTALVASGQINLDARDQDGRTLLRRFVDAWGTDLRMATQRIRAVEARSDEEIRDAAGDDHYWSLLSQRLLERDYSRLVKHLLGLGTVDPHAPDKEGNTPLTVARALGLENAVNLMQSYLRRLERVNESSRATRSIYDAEEIEPRTQVDSDSSHGPSRPRTPHYRNDRS